MNNNRANTADSLEDPANESAKQTADSSPGWSEAEPGDRMPPVGQARFSGRKILSPAKAGSGNHLVSGPRVALALLATPWATFFRLLRRLIDDRFDSTQRARLVRLRSGGPASWPYSRQIEVATKQK